MFGRSKSKIVAESTTAEKNEKESTPEDENAQNSPPSTSKDILLNKGKVKELQFKFRNDIRNVQLKDAIITSYKEHRGASKLSELVELMKKDLDRVIPRGWIVFAGHQMVGACTFIENTMIDFEVEGISFVIFQTYHPEEP